MIELIVHLSLSRFLITTIINIFNAIITFFSQVWLFKYIIKSFGDQNVHGVFTALVLMLIIRIISSVINSIYNCMYAPKSDNSIRCVFQNIIFSHISTVDLASYDNQDFFDKMHRVIFQSNARIIEIINLYGSLVFRITFLFFIIAYIFFSEPFLIILSVIPIILNSMIGKYRNNLNYKKDTEMTPYIRKIEYFKRIAYLNKYAKEIRLTKIRNVLQNQFNSSYKTCNKIIRYYSWKNAICDMLLPLINHVCTYFVTIIYVSYKTLIKNYLTIDTSIIMIQSVWQMNNNLQEIFDIVLKMHEQYVYLTNVNELLNYKATINIDSKAVQCVKIFSESIKLNNVSFSYNNSKEKVLCNINMEIRRGQKIAIVGCNGSGKTTLVKLILRLYDPDSGEVFLDGTNIKEINFWSYRDLFGTLLQDYRIFAMSIKDNIFVDKKIGNKDISSTVNHCGLNSIIGRCKKGINTNITKEFDDEGEFLSGGEEQRIALARAYAKDAEIIILDEPSSALDPIAERDLFRNMMEVCKDKTVIMISHRLSSVINADYIFMMENGKIIEQGSHKELINMNCKYADLFSTQANTYLKEYTFL